MTLVLTFYLVWDDGVELSVGPRIDTVRDSTYIQVDPLTLTWSPTEGFGVESTMQVEPKVQ